MNRFLVIMGVILGLVGLFELFQGQSDWWLRTLQGVGIALAGVALERMRKK